MSFKYTDEYLISKLLEFYNKNNQVPKVDDFKGQRPSHVAYIRRFGSWLNALKVAGLEKEKFGKGNYTEKELLDLLLKYYDEFGEIPTTKKVTNTKGYPTGEVYTKRFGSFKNALIKIGLYDKKMDIYYNKKHYTKEQLVLSLIEYIEKNEKVPTMSELVNDENMPHPSNYIYHFGSYNKALKSLGYTPNQEKINKTNKELLDDLKNYYVEYGEVPTEKVLINSKHMASPSVYFNRFGGLFNALDLAEVPHIKHLRFYSNEEIIDYWYKMKEQLGRIPTTRELENSEMKINLAMLKTTRWRSYTDFLNEIGEKINNNIFGNIYYTTNGVKCLSYYELLITQWFEDNNINFKKEVYYKDVIPNFKTLHRFDWVVEDKYFIEMFGLIGERHYNEKMKFKMKTCQDNNINLITILPQDVLRKPLEETFSFLLN